MDKALLYEIVEHYGRIAQEDMAIEECSELIKALLKIRRGKGSAFDVIDEIADVQIMLEQLKILYACELDVAQRVKFKVDRQIKRIRGVIDE